MIDSDEDDGDVGDSSHILLPREGIAIPSEGPATLTTRDDGVVHFQPSAHVVDNPIGIFLAIESVT